MGSIQPVKVARFRSLTIKYMSILNITNLTNEPEDWIRSKYLSAFEEYQKEFNVTIEDREQHDFIDTQIDYLEQQAEETLGKDLLGLIDNYLVNLDYYAEVKEWYQNK